MHITLKYILFIIHPVLLILRLLPCGQWILVDLRLVETIARVEELVDTVNDEIHIQQTVVVGRVMQRHQRHLFEHEKKIIKGNKVRETGVHGRIMAAARRG